MRFVFRLIKVTLTWKYPLSTASNSGVPPCGFMWFTSALFSKRICTTSVQFSRTAMCKGVKPQSAFGGKIKCYTGHNTGVYSHVNNWAHHSSSGREDFSTWKLSRVLFKREKEKSKPVCLCPPLSSSILVQHSHGLFRQQHEVLSSLQHPRRPHLFQH